MIPEILQQPYDRSRWTTLIHEVFPNVTLYEKPESPTEKPEWIRDFYQLGNVRLHDGKNLAIFEIRVDDKVQLSRNRVTLRELISKKIDLGTTHGVLCVFNSSSPEYRFTFVAKEVGFDDEGAITTTETNSKRYTYVLGPGETRRTAAQRFAELAAHREEAGVKEVIEAFSVERLNKEFFRTYKDHYQAFVDHLITGSDLPRTVFGITEVPCSTNYDTACKPIRDWVKQLLGRIVFIHFIQKKGWMGCKPGSKGWKDGDPQFLKNFFDSAEDKAKFCSQNLASLFFEALNSPDRPGDIFELTGTKIPYLNGGLFDGPDEITRKIDFPENLFKSLLDFLAAYNFTIDENDPEEHEVGIDPEMLGHIFENLLEENKDKGAYYTPKPVVQFMCQQSLLLYLQTHLGEQPGLEELVRQKDPGENIKGNWIRQNASRIEELLDKVTICDPAIGSGAFPMGMLHEIFWIKLSLDWTLNDPKKFAATKRRIIENTIHGVDLDPGAVEIAKLRCWLAIVVDDVEPRPLPNLDFKIHCANSLVEFFRGEPVSFLGQEALGSQSEKHIDRLGRAKAALFESIRKQDKRAAKLDVYRSLIELGKIEFTWLRTHEGFSGSNERVFELNKVLDEFSSISRELNNVDKLIAKNQDLLLDKIEKWFHESKNATFAWKIHFAEVFNKGGFDIVVANPPYIRHEKIGQQTKELLRNIYPELSKRSDLLCYFFLLGERILKKNGISVVISSNSWMDVGFGAQLQTSILNKTKLIELLDTSSERLFENANINPVISFQKKESADLEFKTRFTRLESVFSRAIYNEKQRRTIHVSKRDLMSVDSNDHQFSGGKWGGLYFKAPQIYFDILDVLGGNTTKLGKLCRIEFGLKTGANPFFHVKVLNKSNCCITIETDCGKIFELPSQVVAVPCLISSKEVKRPLLSSRDLSKHVLMLPKKPSNDHRLTNFIKWGEAQDFHKRPSTKSRKPWHSLSCPMFSRIAFASAYDKRALICLIKDGDKVVVDKRFYCIHPNHENDCVLVAALLWSSFSILSREILGRSNFGDGLLEVIVKEANELPLPSFIEPSIRSEIEREFLKQCEINTEPFYTEVKSGRRNKIDTLFLKACGYKDEKIISEKVSEIQREAAKIMWNRIAKSGNGIESEQPFEKFWD